MSPEGRFLFAYDAAIALATAALHASGFRTSSNLPGHHAITLDSLAFTLAADRRSVSSLDVWRRKRHSAVYRGGEAVSDHELAELVALVRGLRGQLMGWLEARHPDLVP